MVGAPTTTTGQAIIAYVTLRGGADEASTYRRCASTSATRSAPSPSRRRSTSRRDLPKTRSGKIMRRLLRDVAEGRNLGDTTTLADASVVDEIRPGRPPRPPRSDVPTPATATATPTIEGFVAVGGFVPDVSTDPRTPTEEMAERDRTAELARDRGTSRAAGRSTADDGTAGMLNGHGMCHGGIMFTLADTAFAHASNSHGPATVAAAASIDFLAPANERRPARRRGRRAASPGPHRPLRRRRDGRCRHRGRPLPRPLPGARTGADREVRVLPPGAGAMPACCSRRGGSGPSATASSASCSPPTSPPRAVGRPHRRRRHGDAARLGRADARRRAARPRTSRRRRLLQSSRC